MRQDNGKENLLPVTEPELDVIDDIEEESVRIDEYSISSYGLDLDVEGIVRRYKRGDIDVPEFQRKYIWNKPQASRFVESLLLGLPVPGIFLYREEDSRKLTVIDGQQRIRTLQFFYDGIYRDGKPFKLIGLSKESKYFEATYQTLKIEDRRKLDDSIIHATIVRQDKPEDDGSSKYAIFERLNTGGTRLAPQEIRTAIYPGELSELLAELNLNASWRTLFGKIPDRQRDEELILRFLALYFEFERYRPSMARFLNEFMKENQNLKKRDKKEISSVFEDTVSTIHEKIGEKAFKPQSTVNAAVLDAVMVGVARRLHKVDITASLERKHKELLLNPDFDFAISGGTSRADKVRQRITLSTQAFANAE